MKSIDLTNYKAGLLTVLGKSNNKDTQGHILWKCKCECGNITYATTSQLLNGIKLSCGCSKKIRKSNVKEILQEILGFVGSNQKFCIVDDEHKTLINADDLFDFIGQLAKKYGVEVE